MFILSLIFGTAHLFFSPTHGSEVNQPNIVFILADDVGYNDVGYHNPEMRTPNIDRLCKNGVQLENYYVQPICSPTRSQLLSGRYQIHTGLQHGVILPYHRMGLSLDSPTLADKLSESGYSTYAVGKWHLGFWKEDYLPTRRGFDRFYGFYLGALDHFKHNRCLRGRCGVDLHDDTPTNFTNVRNESGTYSTHLFTRRAVHFIDDHETGKPLFMYLAYQAPHGPLQVPRSYTRQYKNIRNQKRKIFAGMMTALDEGVGEVVSALQKKGLWNNTILVFSTDNGGAVKRGGSNKPLRGRKGSWFEGGIRGVGFVSSPLLERKGYTNNALIHVSDWFPTFIKLANGTMNGTRDIAGIDQWETISKDVETTKTEILHGIDPLTRAEAPSPIGENNTTFDSRISAAIRVGDYKLITGLGTKIRGEVGEIKTTSKRPGNKNRKKNKPRRKPGRKPGRGGRRKKLDKMSNKVGPKRQLGNKRKSRRHRGQSNPNKKRDRGNRKHDFTSSGSVHDQPSRMSRSLEGQSGGGSRSRTVSDRVISEPLTPDNNLVRLYNIRNDPLEQFDLSKSEPDRVRELLKKLQEYYETSVPPFDPKHGRIRKLRPVDGFWSPQSR